MNESADDGESGAEGRAARRALSRHMGWSLLDSRLGRVVVRAVCALMARRLEARRGAPTLESRGGVIRLWRIDRYGDVSLGREELWVLDDGAPLRSTDSVLELHIRGDSLLSALAAGAPWKEAIAEEFRSLVPLLAGREEIAIVGSTILRRQAIAFGASVRPAPGGLHSTMDTFYRKLILLAFHPGGARRVLTERQTLADAAISLRDFCTRFA